jgi:glycosyltransferase involved in cell wall biosynthesis
MKVLASAYSCGPGLGSEPGAGWQWARAAAERNDVWLLTQEASRDRLERFLDRYPDIRGRLHVVYVAPSRAARFLKSGGTRKHLLHYLAWQRAARIEGRRLHRELSFDVAHHLTWTVAWLPSGVSNIPGVPFVWGPVSGARGIPRGFGRWLGWRGWIQEGAREVALPFARFLFGTGALRRATVVVAQSEEFARWARRKGALTVVVEPVVAYPRWEIPKRSDAGETARDSERRAVFAARMVPWKGLRLAVAAMAEPEAAAWRLDVYGNGVEERAGRRLAQRLGVGERVRFLGRRERAELDEAILAADAFVHPSIHDAPPFVVAEALGMGCPVICIDHGGPAVLVADGEGVKVRPGKDLAAGIARALASAPARFDPSERWLRGRLPGKLDEWYAAAVAAGTKSS